MKPKLLVRGARQLLTLHGPPPGPRRGAAMRALGLIEDGALLVIDGRVAAVGPSRRLENLAQARGAREIQAAGRVVMPGFIDAQTALISGPPVFPGAEAGDAAAARDATTRSIQTLPGPRLQTEATRIIRGAARHGTTTLAAATGYGLTEAGEMKTLRALARINLQPVEIRAALTAAHRPAEFATAGAWLEWMAAVLLPRAARSKLASLADIALDRDDDDDSPPVPAGDAARWLRAAADAGLALRVQVRRPTAETIAMAVEAGAIGASHLNYLERDEMRVLATSETVALLLPALDFHARAPQLPPAREMIACGVPVAIGSGFDHNQCPVFSMQTVVGLACRLLGLTASEAICAATANAAWAVGAADRIGTLEHGMQADFLLLNVSDYRAIPHYFGENLVAMAVKAGEVVFKQGEVKTLDEA